MLRLLYVAMTRAKTKLLISGHARRDEKGNIKVAAWAGKLIDAAGLLPDQFQQAAGEPFKCQTISNHPLRTWCLLADLPAPALSHPAMGQGEPPENNLLPLYQPIQEDSEIANEEEETFEELHIWRAIGQDDQVPGNVLGSMVHKAIQLWLFPEDTRLEQMLEAESYNAGLVFEEQRQNAVKKSVYLLKRFQESPVWEEISSAEERHSELPFIHKVNGKLQTGYNDLLYKSKNGWTILEFKTDPNQTPSHKKELLKKYIPQIQYYRDSTRSLLGIDARACICFLDNKGKIDLVEIK